MKQYRITSPKLFIDIFSEEVKDENAGKDNIILILNSSLKELKIEERNNCPINILLTNFNKITMSESFSCLMNAKVISFPNKTQ